MTKEGGFKPPDELGPDMARVVLAYGHQLECWVSSLLLDCYCCRRVDVDAWSRVFLY